MELLRLLAMLGAGDKHTSENIYATVAEVKRRAEPLGNNIGEVFGLLRDPQGTPGACANEAFMILMTPRVLLGFKILCSILHQCGLSCIWFAV